MCGRYSLTVTKKALARRFEADEAGAAVHSPRFNIAPGQAAPTVVSGAHGRRLSAMTWGFPPPGGAARRLINARIETLPQRAAFRGLLREGRCLVPADGFYEWRPAVPGEPRRPVRCRLQSRTLFAMAGLWRTGPSGERPCYVIVTTRATGPLAAVHDRMPVLLPTELEPAWIDPNEPFEPLARKLDGHSPDEALEVYDVNPAVNRADRDPPACIEPWAGPRQGALPGLAPLAEGQTPDALA